MTRVLVACEFSGVVRQAFRNAGHEAWSCDLLPCDDGSPFHIQDDVLNHLADGWDMMVAHPPCTYLSVSGARWFAGREDEQEAALDFVEALLNAPIHRIALENPVGVISTYIRKPDQIIQPWWFGVDASKRTCLWLKNLQLLRKTNPLIKPLYANQTPSGQNKLGPSEDRWKLRSITYQGVAQAMADQWGQLL